MSNDGGADPHLHLPQYPLNMGLAKHDASNALKLQLDAEGKTKVNVIVKKGGKVSLFLSLFHFHHCHLVD